MKARELYDLIDRIAPFDTQMDSDNSGFLVGSAAQEISAVLFALDVTDRVIDEALTLGADLIVTHHPLMFDPLHTLTDDCCEGRLIRRLVRENICLIAAHTNLDQAPGGINDTLAKLCGLKEISGEGFFRCGLLPDPCPASDLAKILKQRLQTEVRLMGPVDAVIRRVGLCSGGGSSEWAAAVSAGCDAFITGEMKHHIALALADCGVVAFECGHFATEEPGIRSLAAALQKDFDKIKCNVRVYVSGIPAYSFVRQP